VGDLKNIIMVTSAELYGFLVDASIERSGGIAIKGDITKEDCAVALGHLSDHNGPVSRDIQRDLRMGKGVS
jgi:hypothetical protein